MDLFVLALRFCHLAFLLAPRMLLPECTWSGISLILKERKYSKMIFPIFQSFSFFRSHILQRIHRLIKRSNHFYHMSPAPTTNGKTREGKYLHQNSPYSILY